VCVRRPRRLAAPRQQREARSPAARGRAPRASTRVLFQGGVVLPRGGKTKSSLGARLPRPSAPRGWPGPAPCGSIPAWRGAWRRGKPLPPATMPSTRYLINPGAIETMYTRARIREPQSLLEGGPVLPRPVPVRPRWQSWVEAAPPRSGLRGGRGCLVGFLSLKNIYILKKKEGGGWPVVERPAGGTVGSSVASALSRCWRDTETGGFHPSFALLRLSGSVPNQPPRQARPRRNPRGSRGTAARRGEGPKGKRRTGRIWHIRAAPGSSRRASGGRLRPFS